MTELKENKEFVIKLAEQNYFRDWNDESCGNFVGWCKDFQDYTISVDRVDPSKGGLYNFSKMKKGYRSTYNYESNLIGEVKAISLYKIDMLISLLT